jgi:hypothetical protein
LVAANISIKVDARESPLIARKLRTALINKVIAPSQGYGVSFAQSRDNE